MSSYERTEDILGKRAINVFTENLTKKLGVVNGEIFRSELYVHVQ